VENGERDWEGNKTLRALIRRWLKITEKKETGGTPSICSCYSRPSSLNSIKKRAFKKTHIRIQAKKTAMGGEKRGNYKNHFFHHRLGDELKC